MRPFRLRRVLLPNFRVFSGSSEGNIVMTSIARFLAAAAVLGAVAAPSAAQYYPQPQPQPYAYPQQNYPQYPQYPQQNYPGYGYGQGTTGNPIVDVIDQLLGNRYNVTDRQAVRQCANAAMSQGSAQYRGGYGGYNNGAMRVTSITSVERRNNGLRVSGLMSSGGRYANQGYNNRGYGYNNQGYGQQLSFRCNVDYRGAVTGLRVRAGG
jgi:hypothetical protein